MAGGMGRRGERTSLHERIHGTPPASPPSSQSRAERQAESRAETGPVVEPPPIRHCCVSDEHGRLPALLLEWRRTVAGWQGRVVRPVLEDGSWVVVEEWMPGSNLSPP